MEHPEQKPDFATSRVKKVLNREKKALSHELEKEKEHHFSFEKRPALFPEVTPPQPQSSSRQISAKSAEKTSPKQTTMAATALSHNQNYPLALIEKAEALQSKAVKNLRVKEQLIAARRLKAMGHEIQEWVFAQIQWKARQMEEQRVEENHYYPEREEERQFQITRIIPYLSDH